MLVFTVLPGNFVPVVAEFKHGAEEVVIALPGGKINQDETPEVCAEREFLEETGIRLKKVELRRLIWGYNPLLDPFSALLSLVALEKVNRYQLKF